MKQWSKLLEELDRELGTETVNQWLRPLKIVKFDAGNLFLDAADSFQVNWFKEYLAPLLPKRLLTGTGKAIKVHLTVKGGAADGKEKGESKEEEDPFAPSALEPHATLESFISSSKDNLPYNLLKEIAEEKLSLGKYNPIYIYGPKGCGKSHLLMATARMLKEKGKKCFYVRSDTFTEHVIRAFRSTSLQEFRKVYREIEVLIIDDVQLLSRKATTQEELFHTFNRLHTSGLQIILGSSVAPRLLEEIEERLISRFEWGITFSLSPPTEADRLLILEKRAESLSLPLSYELKEYLFTSFKNLNSLIKALEALALRLPYKATPPDLEIAKSYLKDLIEKEKEILITPEKILKAVANAFGIKTEDILGKGQSKEQALPRQIAMYLCRKKLNIPFLKLGQFFSRDHSTVMTSVKRVEKGIEKKEEGFLLPLSDIYRTLNLSN
ncbi:MAG: chromosomal replication initiator protein DnaA [Chlamydiia bacterium]|nr:chromosomal replication initiator protein DnaA [Chlamydiia bacterium]